MLPDINQVFRVGVIIIVGGLILLGFTYLAALILPLIAIAVVIVIGYLLYRFFTTGSMKP